MNTPSHFLMTAALYKIWKRAPIHRGAFLWGSVAPDLPLWVLSLSGIVDHHIIQGQSLSNTFALLFDQLYFHDPVWLAAHNALHAPIVLLAGLGLTWRDRLGKNLGKSDRTQPRSWRHGVFWFLLACLLHTIVDIPTHADDGPLLWFPLNWSIRFQSPVSYWDPRYYGNIFKYFEMGLDLLLLLYLLKGRLKRLIRWLPLAKTHRSAS